MKIYFLIIFFLLSGIAIGWLGNNIYQDSKLDKIDGIWMPQNYTENEAIENAKQFDSKGNWVCVNIKGMSIERMVQVCEHEVGHELFAQKCENNVTKCLEAIK